MHNYRRLYEIYATQINYIFYLSFYEQYTRGIFNRDNVYYDCLKTSEIHQEVCFIVKSTHIVSD